MKDKMLFFIMAFSSLALAWLFLFGLVLWGVVHCLAIDV